MYVVYANIFYIRGGYLVFDWDRVENFFITRQLVYSHKYKMPKLSITCVNAVYHRQCWEFATGSPQNRKSATAEQTFSLRICDTQI